jgi:ABC-type nickel/cobalt efflux system permease component RcnA
MVVPTDSVGLLAGAIALGAVHGIEPGHGWPVAASYALDRGNKWIYGFAASLILGIGHLISSIAMVAVFFYAKSYFSLTQINQPIALDVLGTTITIGGPVSLVAGVLLILLGWREYTHGHSHGDVGHDHGNGHEHDGEFDAEPTMRLGAEHDVGHGHDRGHSHAHEEDHGHDDPGLLARLKSAVPFVGNGGHSHDVAGEPADRGLLGIAWFAFVLGFAHEEEFEIITLCAGSVYCLELMLAYALTVIAGIVGLTLLLIAGYHHSQERVERYTPYLPIFSAAVLVLMGLGFIAGVF